ncbi:MAG: nuclear transport factor 2 family protein [Planctomycetota bacterium]|nr:nuclear transport factor 2 family protein [Planctomycetota bacterium]
MLRTTVLLLLAGLAVASGCGQPGSPPPKPATPPASLGASAPAAKKTPPHDETAGEAPAPAGMQVQASDALAAFLKSYFQSWSDGNMAAYRAHFHPQARICFVNAGKVLYALDAEEFLAQQEKLVKESKVPMEERILKSVVQEDAQAASAVVHWELLKGEQRSTGVDRFTLMRSAEGPWTITSLMFYKSE